MPAGRESLLSLIPHLIRHSAGGCRWGVGVAGWNTSAACSDMVWSSLGGGRGLGALLGPEETPVWCFLVTIPGLAGLTQPVVPLLGCALVGGVVVVAVVGSGCGCVLSVA